MFQTLRTKVVSKSLSLFQSGVKTTLMNSNLTVIRYFGTIVPIKMPFLGEDQPQATIKKWHVKQGTTVNKESDLCDIATNEFEAPILSSHDGVIHKIYVSENEICAVGKTLCDIDVEFKSSSTRGKKFNPYKYLNVFA